MVLHCKWHSTRSGWLRSDAVKWEFAHYAGLATAEEEVAAVKSSRDSWNFFIIQGGLL